MPLIDSHAHLDSADYEHDLALVLARASQAGVSKIINVGAGLASSKKALEIAAKNDNIWATVGIHPEASDLDLNKARIELKNLVASSSKVVAIGECGLDDTFDKPNKLAQKALFKMQIELARDSDLPLVIHLRNGQDETAVTAAYQILKENQPLKGVIHCFTLDEAWAQKFLDLGLHLGFTGIVTYKKADLVRAAVKAIPLTRLLIETDSPYLAPQKYRGKRNEPAYVGEVAKQIAKIRGETNERISEMTRRNSELLFNI